MSPAASSVRHTTVCRLCNSFSTAGGSGHVLRELDLEALDQRVREQLLAHALDLGASLGRVSRVDLQVDEPPHARLPDREAEVAQRRLDRLALGIEDPGLRPHKHGRLHRSTIPESATYASNSSPVSRSNASTYRARVPATTSSGSSGAGGALSQPSDSQ